MIRSGIFDFCRKILKNTYSLFRLLFDKNQKVCVWVSKDMCVRHSSALKSKSAKIRISSKPLPLRKYVYLKKILTSKTRISGKSLKSESPGKKVGWFEGQGQLAVVVVDDKALLLRTICGAAGVSSKRKDQGTRVIVILTFSLLSQWIIEMRKPSLSRSHVLAIPSE